MENVKHPEAPGSPVFTVITTSYNYGRFIGATIESVLAQTLSDWEMIIVDDCSSDDSWEVISRYHDPRVRAIRFEKNQGACAAYNAALAVARGRYIASLDSDDLFAPEKLARQRDFFALHPEVDICGTWLAEVGKNGETLPAENLGYAPWFNLDIDLNDPAHWVWANHLCHSSAVMKKSWHDLMGPFREDLVYTPDWNFWLGSMARGARFAVIHEPLTLYRNHGANITHARPKSTLQEYLGISDAVFHPFLNRLGRSDLIALNLEGFLRHDEYAHASVQDRTNLVERALSGLAASELKQGAFAGLPARLLEAAVSRSLEAREKLKQDELAGNVAREALRTEQEHAGRLAGDLQASRLRCDALEKGMAGLTAELEVLKARLTEGTSQLQQAVDRADRFGRENSQLRGEVSDLLARFQALTGAAPGSSGDRGALIQAAEALRRDALRFRRLAGWVPAALRPALKAVVRSILNVLRRR